MHLLGAGVPQDDGEAVLRFRRAASQGFAPAQGNLGVMYYEGRGVIKDLVLAHMWFNIASANGNERARTGRDAVEDELTRAEISRATELARACMASNYHVCEP